MTRGLVNLQITKTIRQTDIGPKSSFIAAAHHILNPPRNLTHE